MKNISSSKDKDDRQWWNICLEATEIYINILQAVKEERLKIYGELLW